MVALCLLRLAFYYFLTAYFFLYIEVEDSSEEEYDNAFEIMDFDTDEEVEEAEVGVDNDEDGEVDYDVKNTNDHDVVSRPISLALEKDAHLSKNRGRKKTGNWIAT